MATTSTRTELQFPLALCKGRQHWYSSRILMQSLGNDCAPALRAGTLLEDMLPRLRVGWKVRCGAPAGPAPAAPPSAACPLADRSPPHRSAMSGLLTSTLQSSAPCGGAVAGRCRRAQPLPPKPPGPLGALQERSPQSAGGLYVVGALKSE